MKHSSGRISFADVNRNEVIFELFYRATLIKIDGKDCTARLARLHSQTADLC